MFCANCGKELKEDTNFCQFCGAKTAKSPPNNQSNNKNPYFPSGNYNKFREQGYNNYYGYKTPDASSIGFGILCFFFPLVGLILYIIWKDEYPLKAKSCGIGALVSVIAEVVLFIVYIILIIFILSISYGFV